MQRFAISLDEHLAAQFDAWIAQRGYANRSEAVRDLLRAELQQTRLQAEAAPHCVACLSYVYNHRERDLVERLAEHQHAHHDIVVSTMHIELDHEHRLETIALRGSTPLVMAFSDAVCAERGVHHGKLNLISMETHQPHRHALPGAKASKKAAAVGVPHLHLRPAH